MYGLVAVAACQSLYFVAASRLPVGIAILLEYTGPVLVVGWEKLVRHAHVARESAIGVGVAMLGLAVVVQIWSGLQLDAVGIAAGLGAAAGNATFFLLIDRLSGTVDPLTLTTGGMAVGMVVLTPLAVPWSAPWHVLGHSVALGSHQLPGWTLAAFIVLISTILSYLTGAAAIQRLSATVAAGLAYVEPAAATLVAWAALGERLSPTQIAGGVIVLGGAFLAQRGIGHTTPTEEDSARSILGTTVTTEALIP
jgi:drug/metabolite transporter (DMT)-like permease